MLTSGGGGQTRRAEGDTLDEARQTDHTQRHAAALKITNTKRNKNDRGGGCGGGGGGTQAADFDAEKISQAAGLERTSAVVAVATVAAVAAAAVAAAAFLVLVAAAFATSGKKRREWRATASERAGERASERALAAAVAAAAAIAAAAAAIAAVDAPRPRGRCRLFESISLRSHPYGDDSSGARACAKIRMRSQ